MLHFSIFEALSSAYGKSEIKANFTLDSALATIYLLNIESE